MSLVVQPLHVEGAGGVVPGAEHLYLTLRAQDEYSGMMLAHQPPGDHVTTARIVLCKADRKSQAEI